MNKVFSSPAKVFLAITLVLSGSIYLLCDFYLNSLGRELMLNWIKTESLSIQEGNLLTSVTKSQPYLMASTYIQGIQLVKTDGDDKYPMIRFGKKFEINSNDYINSKNDPVVRRVGFLHSQVILKIPGANNFVLGVDLSSNVLNSVFFGSVSLLILILIGIVSALRQIEQQESVRREKLLKLAIHDLVANDQQSEILSGEFPEFSKLWTSKRNEILGAQRLTIESQSKILLGETASRLVHDIKGPLRNIQILTRRMTGLDQKNQEHLSGSIQKISALTSDFSSRTRSILQDESARRAVAPVSLSVTKVIAEKESQYGTRALFSYKADVESAATHWYVDPLELDRSIANLIDNAVDASPIGGRIEIFLSSQNGVGTLEITDFGSGIDEAESDKVGLKGFTQKKEGTGLGVFYAKKMAEECGGKFHFTSSVNQGTTVSISLPIASTRPECDLFDILENPVIVFVDDSDVMLDQIKTRIQSLRDSKSVGPEIILLRSPEEFRLWRKTRTSNTPFFSVIDFHFEGISETGASLIESERLCGSSALFTSAPDDTKVLEEIRRLSVPLISKDQFLIG